MSRLRRVAALAALVLDHPFKRLACSPRRHGGLRSCETRERRPDGTLVTTTVLGCNDPLCPNYLL